MSELDRLNYMQQSNLNNVEADLRSQQAANQISGSIDNISRTLDRLNDDQKIYKLKLEIAKTKDSQIRYQLNQLLDEVQSEIDRKQRVQLIAMLFTVIVICGGVWIYLLRGAPEEIFGFHNPLAKTTEQLVTNEVPVKQDNQKQNINNSEKPVWYSAEQVDLMNLSSQQLSDWVKRLMMFRGVAAAVINDGVHSKFQISTNQAGDAQVAVYVPMQADKNTLKLDIVYTVKNDGTLVSQVAGSGDSVLVATGWNDFVQ